jgi:predicted dehydrogenase
MNTTTIGIIGCGVISDAYLNGAGRSKLIRVKSVADLRPEVAKEKAKAFDVQAATPDALLADPEIDIVVNLTVPLAHAAVNHDIISAGKHVYSEKPLTATFTEAERVLKEARARGVRVGGAPDTFLGASHQACRRAIDAGRIGRPFGGAATVLSHGMEHWHPNPGFFFKRGGGPILDLGPYYVTQLVNLLGPVARVAAQAGTVNPVRTISSEPLKGQKIEVEVPTTATALLTFENGATVTLSASWDVWKHRRLPFEIYGVDGSILVPDPNFFGGVPQISVAGAEWEDLEISAHPFGINNRKTRAGLDVADYRIIGLLDMAAAIRDGRPHRACGGMAAHVLEVLEAILRASDEKSWVEVQTSCERPAPLPLGAGEEVFLQ